MKKILLLLLVLVGTMNAYAQSITFSDAFESNIVMTRLSVQDGTGRYIYSSYPTTSAYDAIYQTRWNTSLSRWEIIFGASGVGPAPTYTLISPHVEWYASGSSSPYPPDLNSGNWQAGPDGGGTLVLTSASGQLSGSTVVPTVTTGASSGITGSTATLAGNVSSDGGASVTEKGVVYSTSANPTTSDSKATNGTGTGAISVGVSSLTASTIYHYRAYAINSVGTSYGADATFTTSAAGVTVSSVTRLASTPTNTGTVSFSAVFSSSITGVTTSSFSVTTTGSLTGVAISAVSGSGTTYTVTVNTGTGDGTIRLNVTGTGVSPTISNIPYTAGEVYTIDKTLPTISITGNPPSITNSSSATFTFTGTDASGIASYQSSLDGGPYNTSTSPISFIGLAAGAHTFSLRSIDAAGNTSLPAIYTWTIDETSPTLTITSSAGVSGGTTSTSPIPFTATFSESVAGFAAADLIITNGTASGFSGSGTTYTFSVTPSASGAVTVNIPAAVAQDAAGNNNTAASQFSITYVTVPTVTTGVSSSITSSTASLAGNVSSDGSASITEKGVVYSTSANPTTSDSKVTNGTGTGAISASVSSLTANTTYHYRAYAINTVGTSYGADATFTTSAATAAINTTGSFTALTTTYGTASSGSSISVTGTGLTAGITVTPSNPAFEVSSDGTTYSSGFTAGSSGTVSLTLYIRLKSTASAGSYNAGSVGLSSGAVNQTVNIPTSMVSPAPLTIAANNQTKVYGAAVPTLVASYTGFVNGDTPASLTIAPTLSTTATAASSVAGSPYAITASGAVDANYAITYVAGNLTVTPASLTITANNKTKVYGAAVPILTASYSGFVNGDTPLSLTTSPILSTTATAASSVAGSPYPIAASGAVNANYTISYVAGALTVTPASLTITADNQTKVYGAAVPALTASYSGFVNGDTPLSLTTSPILSTTATPASSVAGSPYPIAASGAVNANYTISYVAGALTVTPASLTITADNQTKVYGAAVPSLTASYSGFVNGDTPASLTTLPTLATTATPASSVAGSSYPITASGAVNANYTISYVAGNLTVTPASLTITADNKTKVYGAAVPTLTASYSGFVNGDTPLSLTTSPILSTTATPASSVAGSPYAITASGALNTNYTISYVAGILTVTPASLTITADNKTKVYGAAVPTLTASYSGFVNGDTPLSLTTSPILSTTATPASSVAGSPYPIAASGAVNTNYTISYVAGILTVTPASLTITADNKTKVYGAAVPTLTASYSGFVNGDAPASLTTLPTLATTATTASSVAGNPYPITASGAANINYAISYVAGTLTVTPESIAVTADAKSKTYGDADPALTYTYTGTLVTGDAFTGALSRATGENIGTYAINQNTLALSSNYALTYSGANLTIGTRAIAVTADAKAKTYGDADPALTYTYTGTLVTGDTFTGTLSRAPGENIGTYAINQNTLALNSNYALTYTGANLTIGTRVIAVTADAKTKTYGDADPALTYTYTGTLATGDAFTGALSRASGENVGTYAISQNTLALNPNYALTYTGANLTIGTRAIAVTADAKSKTYGDADPALTYTYTGTLVTGDAFTGALSRASGENVGTYAISQNTLALNPNYALTYTGANLTVGTRAIAVTADAKSKTYGDADPALTYTYTGTLATGDAFTGALSRASGENVGTYAISQNTLALNPNYALTYTGANLTVGTRAIAVTADAKSKTYGDADPALTYTYTGTLVTGDTFTGTLSRAPGENIGTYAINQNTLALSSNYALTYSGANLTIGTRAIAVTADAKSKTYGDADPALTYTYTGTLVTGDAFTGALSRAPGENIGTYAISQNTLALNPNYALTYSGANLTIGTRAIAVTADAKSKTYGDADPALTYTYTGTLVTGDTFLGSLSRAAGEVVGNYAINKNTLALNSNYVLTYTGANLVISKAPLRITADNKSRLFLLANPPLTLTYSGFKFSDTPASLTSQPIVTTTAVRLSLPGAYPITVQGAASANYDISYRNGQLTVLLATRTIAFNALPQKTYGDPDFSAGASLNTDEIPVLTSSNTNVATIVNGQIHIVGAGTTVITAAAPDNDGYTAIDPISQILIVDKAQQTISFAVIPNLFSGDSYDLSSVKSSAGLPVTLTVADQTIASISGTKLNALAIGTTSVTASAAGNANYYAAANVTQPVKILDKFGAELIVRKALSPNGDGINDFLYIEGIKDHPVNSFTVINRNGVKIFEVKNYNNADKVFVGRSSVTGDLQTAGTYFYLIELNDGGTIHRQTGYFLLKYQN